MSRRGFPEDEDYKAPLIRWKEFMESDVWHDLQLFIVAKLEFQQDRLALTYEERINNEGTSETDDMIRGRLREALDLLNAPEAIIQELAELEEVTEEEN